MPVEFLACPTHLVKVAKQMHKHPALSAGSVLRVEARCPQCEQGGAS